MWTSIQRSEITRPRDSAVAVEIVAAVDRLPAAFDGGVNSASSCSGSSSAAESKSQSGSASQSTLDHGSPGSAPRQLQHEPVVLDQRHVLEQAAEGHVDGGSAIASCAAVSPAALRSSTER